MGYRICDECGKKMSEGYVIDSGCYHYCSDACLTKNMTMKHYLELYDDGNGDSYWTAWEDEDDTPEDESCTKCGKSGSFPDSMCSACAKIRGR